LFIGYIDTDRIILYDTSITIKVETIFIFYSNEYVHFDIKFTDKRRILVDVRWDVRKYVTS